MCECEAILCSALSGHWLEKRCTNAVRLPFTKKGPSWSTKTTTRTTKSTKRRSELGLWRKWNEYKRGFRRGPQSADVLTHNWSGEEPAEQHRVLILYFILQRNNRDAVCCVLCFTSPKWTLLNSSNCSYTTCLFLFHLFQALDSIATQHRHDGKKANKANHCALLCNT